MPDSKKILVVEDNPGDSVLITEYLQEEFFAPTVLYAKTSREAQQIISATPNLDVVLLDLTLPDESGESLISKTIMVAGSIPVIVLTGFLDRKFAIKSITLGTSDYLVKDELNPALLGKSINYAIERKKSFLQLAESEKRYRDLFHASPLPMWVLDESSWRFLDVNQAAIRQYGYTRGEFSEMTVFDIRLPEDILILQADLDASAGFQGQYEAGQYRHQKKSGEVIDVEISASAIEFNGKRARLILVKEVTQQKRYVTTIEDQNNRLREIAWMQSHIVREPLARLMALIDLINNHQMPESERKEFLEHVLQSANEIDAVIKGINDRSDAFDLSPPKSVY